MRLLKLELNGFKSFADKTDFTFEPGVTAFVGPNGCGKSNVVDAVRWILGEQSAKAVRGTAMQDVIFNGGGGRKPKNFAEASLTVLNDRGLLGSDYTEVCVTRRLYSTGESEYLLNRQPCRLRDIRELFMDTGVGMHTYSIIEQGKVARLLQANPQERRTVFEEAAGISKFKAQRKAAQAKLERTQENLERARMILGEKERRLNSIKNQAAKARRWQEYQERLKQLHVLLGLRHYRHSSRLRQDLLDQAARVEARERELAAQLEAAERSLADLECLTAELEQAHGVKQEDLYQIDSRIQAAEECIRRNTDLLREYADGLAEAHNSIQGAEERLSRTQEELAQKRQECEALRATVREQAVRIEEERARAQELGAECDRLQEAIETWKSEMLGVVHRGVELRNEITSILEHQSQDGARQERLTGKRREIESALAQLAESVRGLRERRDVLDAELAEQARRQEQVEQERLKALGLVASAEDGLRGLREREAALRERRQVLMDLDTGAGDVEEGVRWLLRDENRLPGVLGMVADLVRVDGQYSAALEAALANRAQYVVAQDTEAALHALRRLSAGRGGRAGVLALDRLAPAAETSALAGRPGVIGRGRDLARFAPEHEPLVAHLLADVWVVDGFDTAVALARDGGSRARLVTLQGQAIEPSGEFVGGEALRRTGIISRRSDLDALAGEMDELGRQIGEREAERGNMSRRAEDLAAEGASLREAIEAGRRDRHVMDTELQDHERQAARLREEFELILAEVREIEEDLAGFTAREQQIRRDLDQCDAMKARLDGEIRQAQERLAVQRAAAAELRDQIESLRVALARQDQKREGTEAEAAALGRAARDLDEQLAGARAAIESYDRKQRESERAIAASREELAVLADRQAVARKEMEDLRLRRQAANEQRRDVFDSGQALRAQHDQARRELADLRVEENRHTLDMRNVEGRLQADWGMAVVSADAETPPFEDGQHDWSALEAEAADVQRKVQQMGGVNTDAVAEQEALEAEIHSHLAQREDLEKAEHQLRQIIRKINRQCHERFNEAFTQVRANFQEMFRKLFGGGNADLRMDGAEGDDPLEAGIEIVARPPGKEPKSIIQLSGGEQTMTTVALIFAIFKRKPSPFCILDEVDAALDEANIDRFCAIVREFLEHSQFIIITHSKRTMALADTLYGITMVEQGVSTKLAVKVEEAA